LAKKEDEIRDVVRSEKSRLRPAQKAAEKKHAERMRLVDELLKRGTEDDVLDAIREAGLDPESPEAKHVLRVWRQNRY
jgi:hypothetical protein